MNLIILINIQLFTIKLCTQQLIWFNELLKIDSSFNYNCIKLNGFCDQLFIKWISSTSHSSNFSISIGLVFFTLHNRYTKTKKPGKKQTDSHHSEMNWLTHKIK